MAINYLLWVIAGFTGASIAYYIDKIKHDSLDLHLLVGGFAGFLGGFGIQNVVWMDGANEINLLSMCASFVVAFLAVELIDYFYCLV